MTTSTVDIGQLLNVFVPFFLGVLATVATPMFTTWWQDKIERRNSLSAKFEELVAAVYQLDDWTDRYRACWFFGEPDPGPSPMMRLVSLSGTYFSELETPIQNVERATTRYLGGMLRGREAMRAGDSNFSAVYAQEEAGFISAKSDLVDALRNYAKKHFQK